MVAMQQVWPRFIPAVDHLEVYEQAPRPHSSDRPWAMLCMITSVDGSVSVQGRSAPLGGPVDWAVLTALRGCADAIVVGAGTARSEDYGPPSVAPEVRERRRARGQEAMPLLAVVSARGELDPAARLFGGPERVRLYLAGTAPAGRREALAGVADVRPAGDRTADAAAVIADLAAEGRSLILLEGGPRLNAAFAAADLIDEFCITRSPLLAPGGGGMIEGAAPQAGLALQLDRLLVADGMTFARYLRRRDPHESA
ncbi:MAG: dihydrofolate reductase family protein [bacterium]|nr:dihydrofolate reductase family protein [bacterium]MCY3951160.1 dihydrofolate reductase family protein [bacterium]